MEVKYKTINCNGETIEWCQKLEEVLIDWWTNDGNNLPDADDTVINCTIDGKECKVADFSQLVIELNIAYWARK